MRQLMISVMFPILARYGALFVYSYTVMMALGITAGIGLTIWATRKRQQPDWFDALLIVLFAAIIGGRIGFVLLRWDYFQQRPSEAWQIWQGGSSYHGALIAGLLALLLWSAWRGLSYYQYAALLAPAFALVTVFGWAACWLEGCAYGRQTIIGPLAADLPDDLGVFAVRYQTQLMGIILALTATILIVSVQNRRSSALIFWFALASLSLAHLLAGLLRGDPVLQIGFMRLDVLLDFLLVIISLLLLRYERSKNKRNRVN
jgi:phosphatidylglycerol:prolipoprotein diacylglycerol transferase